MSESVLTLQAKKVVTSIVQAVPSLSALQIMFGTPTKPTVITAIAKYRRPDGEWDEELQDEPPFIKSDNLALPAEDPNRQVATYAAQCIMDAIVNTPGPFQNMSVRQMGAAMIAQKIQEDTAAQNGENNGQ